MRQHGVMPFGGGLGPAAQEMTVSDLFRGADSWLLQRVQEFDPRPTLNALTLDAAGGLLVAIREARKALTVAEREVEQRVAELFTPDAPGAIVNNRGRVTGVEVPGVGVLERHRAGGRKGWRHDECRAAVVARLSDDLPFAGAVTSEGERVPVAAIVEAVVASWSRVSGYAWKVGGLRELGIDPDEYSLFTPAPDAAYTVEVH